MGKQQEQKQRKQSHDNSEFKPHGPSKTIENGVEVVENEQVKPQNQVVQKKKIIKKFPFISNLNKATKTQDNSEVDQLKDWKPVQLNKDKNGISNKKGDKKVKEEIVSQFFSSLPKPKSNKNDEVDSADFLSSLNQRRKVKPLILIDEVEQKIELDGQDEFLKKAREIFVQQQKMPSQIIEQKKPSDHLEWREQDDEVVEKIEWIKQKGSKDKSKNIAEIVSQSWQKQLKSFSKQGFQ